MLGVLHEEIALDYRAILPRHVTAEIPLEKIVSDGFEPLSRSKADSIKVQVYPAAGV